MTKILDVLAVPIQGAYYYEDIAALQSKSITEVARWTAPAVTPGFRTVREVATGVSLGLKTEGGIFWGDCVAVSYSGKAGRKGVFRTADGMKSVHDKLSARLKGADVPSFREAASGKWTADLHPAMGYGLSQALLSLVAAQRGETPWRTLCREYGLPVISSPVSLQGSSGNDTRGNADKMIANRLEALPHGQIDDPATQMGPRGETLLAYFTWLRGRISELGGEGYRPTIHFDVHGAIATAFPRPEEAADFLGRLKSAVEPLPLRMESVAVAASREAQRDTLGALRQVLRKKGIDVALVVDEWANTLEDIRFFAQSGCVDWVHIKMPDLGGLAPCVEAVVECKAQGVGALLGGSCIETDLSTRLSVHVALAARPDAFLVKPGMGVNEGISLVRNEMARTLATA